MNAKGSGSTSDGRGVTAERELVDIAWVAKRLGVTVRHVRRLVAEERIPIIKWGHLLRFDPAEIESWTRRRPPAAFTLMIRPTSIPDVERARGGPAR